MMLHPRWGGGGAGLSRVVLYVFLFVFIVVGLPTAIVLERWWSMPRKSPEFTIRLLREDLGEIQEMDLEDYLVGVVAAEMPANFDLEALKAQAVAARTYALYRLQEQGSVSERLADLSSDFRSGQAWMSIEAQRERWGWYGYLHNRWRITSSIEATSGEVLTYQEQPIFAAYHSTSGGMTQDAGAYFNEVPYLLGVPSPNEEISPYYQSAVHLSWQEVATRLDLEIPPEAASWVGDEARLMSEESSVYDPQTVTQEEPSTNANSTSPTAMDDDAASPTALDFAALFQIGEFYPSGRVHTVEVLGHSFTGRQIREKLGLRSNWFTVTPSENGIIFDVRGNGHGVGMSQYGAQAMAQAGHSYRDILHHYYTGVQLTKWY